LSDIKKDNKNITSFGCTSNGKESFCYTLRNSNGLEIAIIDYGATIQSIKIPISSGKKVDVVLGFNHVSDYEKSFTLSGAPFIGAVVGRYAGRIKNGSFKLNDDVFQLNRNLGQHHLHGGKTNFSNSFWNVISHSNNCITLEYISKDVDENYPGDLTVQVTYNLSDIDELEITYTAKTTKDTIINLTQHSYFNLDGHKKTIENQKLQVTCSEILETDEENVPTGNFSNIIDTSFDFLTFKKCPTKIDTSFVISDNSTSVATLKSTENKIQMQVFTNQPSVHIYVGGNCENKIIGKNNVNYHALSGICFETQNYPDAPNHSNFPNAILRKDETYNQKTSFKFEKI
jgi:aldose 1-epimerase